MYIYICIYHVFGVVWLAVLLYIGFPAASLRRPFVAEDEGRGLLIESIFPS